MSSGLAIKVDGLSKCYRIYDKPHERLLQFFSPVRKKHFREFWALKDISFEVSKGETVGIIGRNGSGKTTLLQLICGTLTPTSGSAVTFGRVAALLSLGAGFNPDFTGRENVSLSCALLGLTEDESNARFEDIVAFADIGIFLDQPVKTYSSGMFVRLAFAVNIMASPDIMIVDEALAVGDMNFQAKCMTALKRIQESGTTILFVSHEIGTVKSLCSKAVYLEKGQVVAIGSAAEVGDRYVRTMHEEMNAAALQLSASKPDQSLSDEGASGDSLLKASPEHFKTSDDFDKVANQFRYGTGVVKTRYVELLSESGKPVSNIEFNQKVTVRVYFEAYKDTLISVNISFFDSNRENVAGCGFAHLDQPLLHAIKNERYIVEYDFCLPLQEGNYSIRVNISSPIIHNETAEFIDVIENAVVFKMLRWQKARIWSKVHLFSRLRVYSVEAA